MTRAAMLAAMRRDLRRKDKEKLAELRAGIKRARQERKDRIATARASCREAARELRARQRAERIAERASCARSVVLVRKLGADLVRKTRGELADERGFQASQRLAERHARERLREDRRGMTAAQRRAERARESDDEVRNNLPRELVEVFDKVKRHVKAGPRRSRTEAFLEWTTDHPARVYEIQEAAHARKLARLEREERALSKAMRKASRYKGCEISTGGLLDDEIPF